MRRSLWSVGVVLVLTTSGCIEGLVDSNEGNRTAGMEAASAPVHDQFTIVFNDVNPCSGLIHTVTLTGFRSIHEHDGRFVIRIKRTITTSSGFVGRGGDTFVANGNIEKVSINDMLTNESGDRIRAHLVIVTDASTGLGKAVSRSLTCLRS
jgi:hypothetical protein